MLKQVFGLGLALLLTACVPAPDRSPTRSIPQPAASGLPPTSPAASRSNLPVLRVGLLLPLSGESASLGNALLDAASLALYDSYLSLPPEKMTAQVLLLPYDAGSTAAETATATKLALEQGAQVLLGPLFSQNVPVAAALASPKGVPLITFSNNRSVASANTLVFGFIPEQQIDRIAEYALQHQIERIAMIAPNDAYGEKVKSTLITTSARNGGQIGPIELYSASAANLDAAISRLAQNFTNTPPQKRYQALFIAEGGYQLKALLETMKKYRLDPKSIKLLGTGQWDDPVLMRNPDLLGAWFASAPPDASQNFDKRFMANYHYKPARIASLSYDAVTIVTRLALAGNGIIQSDQLKNPQGFMTPAGGIMRFQTDNVANRKLSVLEIRPAEFHVLEAAPKNF